jgi:hypothetical protein
MWSFEKICRGHFKKKDNWVSKQSNTLTWACARFQPDTMATKKQIWNDVRKGMFMHAFWNILLKMICFSFS